MPRVLVSFEKLGEDVYREIYENEKCGYHAAITPGSVIAAMSSPVGIAAVITASVAASIHSRAVIVRSSFSSFSAVLIMLFPP